jgi:hypothetical protein
MTAFHKGPADFLKASQASGIDFFAKLPLIDMPGGLNKQHLAARLERRGSLLKEHLCRRHLVDNRKGQNEVHCAMEILDVE